VYDANQSRRVNDAEFFPPSTAALSSQGRRSCEPPGPGAKGERDVEPSVQMRAECLEWTLVLGRGHLPRILRTYVR